MPRPVLSQPLAQAEAVDLALLLHVGLFKFRLRVKGREAPASPGKSMSAHTSGALIVFHHSRETLRDSAPNDAGSMDRAWSRAPGGSTTEIASRTEA